MNLFVTVSAMLPILFAKNRLKGEFRMCTLSDHTVDDNPELALYGVVFNPDRTGSFTKESIEQEISVLDAGDSMKAVLGKCFRNWLDSELIYRSYDGYRIS